MFPPRTTLHSGAPGGDQASILLRISVEMRLTGARLLVSSCGVPQVSGRGWGQQGHLAPGSRATTPNRDCFKLQFTHEHSAVSAGSVRIASDSQHPQDWRISSDWSECDASRETLVSTYVHVRLHFGEISARLGTPACYGVERNGTPARQRRDSRVSSQRSPAVEHNNEQVCPDIPSSKPSRM